MNPGSNASDPPPIRTRGRRPAAPRGLRLLGWGALLAVYLGLAGRASATELLTGIVVASLVAAWSAAIRYYSKQRFVPTATHTLHWGRALLAVLPAIPRVGARLGRIALLGEPVGRHLIGRVVARGFDSGSSGAPDRARRASALLIASIGPESYVLRFSGRQRVLLHTFGVADPKVDRQWLS